MSVFHVPSVFQACSEHGASKCVPVFHPLRGEHGEHAMLGVDLQRKCVPEKAPLKSNFPELKFPSLNLPLGWRPTIVIDSREQTPLPISFPTVTSGLSTGDYSAQGLEDDFTIERKSLSDLYGSLTSGRERFTRELQRMRAFGFSRLLIIGSVHEIEQGAARHRGMNPKSVIHSLHAIEARGVPVAFAPSPEAAAALVERWAFWRCREVIKSTSQFVKE